MIMAIPLLLTRSGHQYNSDTFSEGKGCMKTSLLHPSFGVQVDGLDLATADLDAVASELRQLYERSRLLLLREQRLTPDRHVAFASLFGPILEERGAKVGHVSNVRPDGITPDGALLFHSDLAFTPEPLPGLSLHALEVPADGAPTVFASAVRAAAEMAPDLRARVADLRVVNVYGFTLPYDRRMRERDLPPGSPVTEHPVIARHPRTGDEIVMANELHTDRVIGVSERESEDLLEEIFAVLYAPEHLHRHEWLVGDVLVWDNTTLQHSRPSFQRGEARTLQRVTIAERGTYDLVPNLDQLLGRGSGGR
jgi:taurine dioxygenase